ncbi:MAG: hypothetical protein ACI819_001837 [Neolewinella sp.]|jgi:hypothetical protein
MFKSILSFALTLFAFSAMLTAANTDDPQGDFISDTDALLKRYVKQGRVDYVGLKASNDLDPLIQKVATVDLSVLKGNDKKAFLINAYNLLVIKQVLENYPLKSVLDVNGFFDGKKQNVGGRKLTLNQLEKELLLKEFNDARLHFVLVCGALGCPPIINFAYTPAKLEAQLSKQTKLALNDPAFLRVNGDKAELSKIFEWYASDFGGSKSAVLSFINKYRDEAVPTSAKVSYYTYDWTLNKASGRASAAQKEKMEAVGAMEKEALADGTEARGDKDMEEKMNLDQPGQQRAIPNSGGGGNNAARYVVSSTIPVGSAEIKIFNNLYSQEAAGERSSFFTASVSALYGVINRLNVGIDLRYRRVRYDEVGAASNFAVLSDGGTFSRTVISGFGPKVRFAPFNNLPNFSIQSALWIPLANNLEGGQGSRFTDWNLPTWFTQVFNDFPIGNYFSVFAEVDFVLEDIGDLNRFSTPVTGIMSYFPTPKATLYGLASYSPFWQEEYDFFYQLGAGAKYQFTPKFEVELLATAFDNSYLQSVDGNAGTVNLGIRVNL